MNVISMMHEINLIANPMIGESSFPDFLLSTDDGAEFMRVRALDQLNGPLDGYVDRGSQQEMNVFRHKDKGVQCVSTLAAVSIQGLQKETCVEFDDEQLSAAVRREGHEISSRRGDESSGLQGETSAAESRASLQSLNWHEWNSCPSRWFFVASGFDLGRARISRTHHRSGSRQIGKGTNSFVPIHGGPRSEALAAGVELMRDGHKGRSQRLKAARLSRA